MLGAVEGRRPPTVLSHGNSPTLTTPFLFVIPSEGEESAVSLSSTAEAEEEHCKSVAPLGMAEERGYRTLDLGHPNGALQISRCARNDKKERVVERERTVAKG